MQTPKTTKIVFKKKKAFTLLELLVAIVLISVVAGAVGWRMYAGIEKKRFQAEVERVKFQIVACQRLAIATQSDWQGVFKLKNRQYSFEVSGDMPSRVAFTPQVLHSTVSVNGRNADEIVIDFYSSGVVLPTKSICLSYKGHRQVLDLIHLFEREEGQKEGPAYPTLKK